MIRQLKSLMRSGLQSISNALLPPVSINADLGCKILGEDGHYFVGYYDIDPVSESGDEVLCHRVSTNYTHQSEPDVGDLGLLSISTGKFSKFAETNALNWQLGSRVRWLTNETVIYNDVVDGQQCSIAYNIKQNKIEKYYKRPFWALSPNKEIGASLNFARIREKRPGYGYAGKSPDGHDEVLTLFSIENDDILFQIDLGAILEKVGFTCPPNVDPYLNHVTWSTCSTKFLTLFHFDDPVSLKRSIYPVLIDCSDYSVSLFYDEGIFSHHVWVDDKSLIGFVEQDGKRGFALWTHDQGWEKMGENMPHLDGHPSLVPGYSDAIVVDSYPDRLGRMSLYTGSTQTNVKLNKLATIMSSKNYTGPLRCDLHPRVSRKNKDIICDMPFKDGRRVLVVEGAFHEK